MTAITFDTHEFIKSLRDAGFEEKQAEALSSGLRKAQENQLSNLVTKDDLEIKLAPVRADLQLLKWMMGVMLAGILSLILKSFF